jgi:predicted phage terminase large subunit-like protein
MVAALPSLEAVDAQLAARELREFVPMAWPIVERRAFKGNWHIDAICEHLQAVSLGELDQLIINIPPRHMKSLAVAVFWPCWEWLTRPETRWLFASYAEKLSKRDSLKCRRIVESLGGRREGGTLVEQHGYQGLLRLLGSTWALAGDQNEKLRFENTETGYRLATSVGGAATGEGGDIIVIDDPHKADEVDTETGTQRETVLEWMDGTMSTRLNDPATGRVVVVMQRLHERDLTGHLLEQGGWTHLCLPAEFEPSHPFVWPGDPRSEPGELLWPGHFNQDALGKLKVKLGSYKAAGQLQQRPAPAEGGIFKTAWWQYYDPALLDELDTLLEQGHADPGRGWHGPHFQRVWQSWDTSLKEKTDSDFAVGQVWGQDQADRYLLRQVRGRMGLTETKQQIRQTAQWVAARFPRFGSHSIFIEKAANAPEVLAALRHEIAGLTPVTASVDKVTRAYAVTPQIESGNVYVPGHPVMTANGYAPDPVRTPAWVQELLNESASFPNGANDDQVDALTQALDPRRLARAGSSRPDDEWGKGKTITGGFTGDNV